MSDEDVNEIIENLRGRMAELTEVTEDRLPQDGDTVDVDYSGTDEECNKIDDVQGENFGVALGPGPGPSRFRSPREDRQGRRRKDRPRELPRRLPPQAAGGKTVIFTIKVNKIQTSQKPEVNEEFAQKVGPGKPGKDEGLHRRARFRHEGSGRPQRSHEEAHRRPP